MKNKWSIVDNTPKAGNGLTAVSRDNTLIPKVKEDVKIISKTPTRGLPFNLYLNNPSYNSVPIKPNVSADSLYYNTPYTNGNIINQNQFNINKNNQQEQNLNSIRKVIDSGQTISNAMEMYPPTALPGFALNAILSVPSMVLNAREHNVVGMGADVTGLIPYSKFFKPIVQQTANVADLSYNSYNAAKDFKLFKNGGQTKSKWTIIDDIPKFPNGGTTTTRSTIPRNAVERAPIYVSDPNDPKLKLYKDSSDIYNNSTLAAYNLLEKHPEIKLGEVTKYHPWGSSIPTKNYFIDYDATQKENFLSGNFSEYTDIEKNKIKPLGYQHIGEGEGFPLYKKPVQPYMYVGAKQYKKTLSKIFTPFNNPHQKQEEINIPTMGSINSSQQISQPINNIQPITSIPKDYVTITDPNMYRNPDTNAFQHKTYRIDKSSGKRISEPSFKNGGQTKSNWTIIE